MSRYRLYPTAAQESVLLEYCAHARFVWNLGLEQWLEYRPGRGKSPGFAEQSRQLTEARADNPWLAAGPVTIQQQALRDLDQAKRNFYAGTHGKPSWRKKGIHDGFRMTGPSAQRIEKINKRWSRVLVPKLGWVKIRRTRDIPEAKSYRVTRDRAGRWHIAFAVVPNPVTGPGDSSVVGIDRGIAITLMLSDGNSYQAPEPLNVRHAKRSLSRARRGSNRRSAAKERLARLEARSVNARKDWVEKTSTSIARSYDLIRIEDLRVQNMMRSARGTVEAPGTNVNAKASLNRRIKEASWSKFAVRLEHKAFGRVEKVNPAFTSQRCSVCGHVDRESRKSQALFLCTACGNTLNADLNAAINIAVGHTVTARGGNRVAGPVNREPVLATD